MKMNGVNVTVFEFSDHINKKDAIWPFGTARYGISATSGDRYAMVPFEDEKETLKSITIAVKLLNATH